LGAGSRRFKSYRPDQVISICYNHFSLLDMAVKAVEMDNVITRIETIESAINGGAYAIHQKTHPNKGHSLYSYHHLDWDEGCSFEQGLPILFEPLPC